MLKRFVGWYLGPIDLTRDSRASGAYGWVGLVLVIVAYDVFAIRTRRIETLSRYFWRSAEQSIAGPALRIVWVWLTFHLLFEAKVRKILHAK